MGTRRTMLTGSALIIIAMLVMPIGIGAQDSGYDSDYSQGFTQEELAQMLAPIALYPDSLIAQILMASTYPLEVVEAERWLHENEGLENEELDSALQEETWDPSVKSLCHFPDVLFAMSEKLDQTRKLGDAYLAQQEDVMATIQILRKRAEHQGNLETARELTVTNEDDYIRIEPTDPRVVYVPIYNPLYVYGSWWYPYYPPWYWYYPPHVVIRTGNIVFSHGFFIGLGIFSWCWFDWHAHHIYVHYERSPFSRGRYVAHVSGKHYWKHSAIHRRGVAYRDRRTSVRFGQHRPGYTSFDREKRGFAERKHERREMRSNEPSRRSFQEKQREPEFGHSTERQNIGSGHPSKVFDKKPVESSQTFYQERQWKPAPKEKTERVKFRSTKPRESSSGRIGRGSSDREAGQNGAQDRRIGQTSRQSSSTGRLIGSPRSGLYESGGRTGVGFRR